MGALEISYLFKKNLLKLRENLISVLEYEDMEIEKVETLKEKLIIGKQYKVTCLACLRKAPFKKILFQIHDNKVYFERSVFALRNLGETKQGVRVQKFYGADSKLKIVYMEYIEDDFLYDYLLKKKMNTSQIKRFAEIAGSYLAGLHKFRPDRVPRYLSQKLNGKIEEVILRRTIEFIKPNIKSLTPSIKKNLTVLLKRIDYLSKINNRRLIHGDYQPANFFLSKDKKIYLMDFDTLEFGNPARDLGRFLAQMEQLLIVNNLSRKAIGKLERLFLDSYSKSSRLDLKPDLRFNLNTYKAEMIQYMILGRIWGDKVPLFKEIEKLLDYQKYLLNI